MPVKNILKAIPFMSIDSATVGAAYQPINPDGLPQACSILRIINNSNMTVSVSYDGVTDHDLVPNDTSLMINAQANAQPNNFIAQFPIGTVVYVKGDPGDGAIVLVGYYQPVID